jgi:hypothetical protein
LRWKNDDNNNNTFASSWEMQTRVTTFQRGDQIVELHAQLHYGDKEYYQFWNDCAFYNQFDKVLFELLVDASLLEPTDTPSTTQYRYVKQPIMASPTDQAVAAQYGWDCQANMVDYTQPKWIHADMTRQEFVNHFSLKNPSHRGKISDLPLLWKLVSPPESSSTAAEAVAAWMVGPPTLSYSSKENVKRRLFTNLFLPGGSFSSALRSLLWWTVPSPELSIVLLDWSSFLLGTRGSSSTSSSRNPSTAASLPVIVSKMALPILSSLLRFDILQMRRFFFGQVLLSSSSFNTNIVAPFTGSIPNKDESPSWSLLVTQRNDHALQVLETTLRDPNVHSVALLYGSSHCPNLHYKLVHTMGFTASKSTWRTAWSVCGNNKKDTTLWDDSKTTSHNNRGTVLPALSGLVALYLLVGALDWVNVLGDVCMALEKAKYLDATVESILYLVRHVLLYLGLSKFLVDWTSSSSND